MCTPIVIDSSGLSPLRDKATAVSDGSLGTTPKADPAGTGTTAPGPVAADDTAQKDTPALAADEGRVFVPGANVPTASSVTSGTTAPVATSSDAKTDTPTGSDTSGGKATDPIADQNTLLINSLTTLAHKFSDTTAGILQGQTDAASALTGGFLNLSDQQQKALEAANQLRQNTGQQARNPSYSLSMAKTQRANSKGVGSTMLTGVTGVPTNQLALGRAQLLGGAPA